MKKTIFMIAMLIAVLIFIFPASAMITIGTNFSQYGVIDGEFIDYNVSISENAENVSSLLISLIDALTFDTVSSSSDKVGQNFTIGTFNNIEDGGYFIFVELELSNGTSKNEQFNFTVDNIFKLLGYSNPTPENNVLLNSANIGSSKIIGISNKDGSNISITIENSTFLWTYNFTGKQTNFEIYDYWISDFGDGIYNFSVSGSHGEHSAALPKREITIKATVPNVTNFSILNLPTSVTEDVEFSISTYFNVTEIPVNVRISAYKDTENYIGNQVLSSFPNSETKFSGTLANPGFYNLSFIISDNYGNFIIFNLGNITVNQAQLAPTNPESSSSGGGGGSGGSIASPSNINITNSTDNIVQNSVPKNTIESDSVSDTIPEENNISQTNQSGGFITGDAISGNSIVGQATYAVLLVFAMMLILFFIIKDLRSLKRPKKRRIPLNLYLKEVYKNVEDKRIKIKVSKKPSFNLVIKKHK